MRSAFEFLPACVVAAFATCTHPAFAEEGAEPTYGRIEGDVCVVVGGGATFSSSSARAEGELRLRYLESAGAFATYEDGALVGSGSEPTRVVATGLELRPVFLFRWLQGFEMQRAGLDLTLDSLGIELATTFSQPSGGNFESSPGLQAGLSVETPVQLSATGLWLGLHGGLRWGGRSLALETVRTVDDRSFYVSLTLAWHQVLVTHVADWGDRAP